MAKAIPKIQHLLSAEDGIVLPRIEPDFDVFGFFSCNKCHN